MILEKIGYKNKSLRQTLESTSKTDSTGIGLAIVKKIIETEGGKIQLESQINRGTTFRFTWLKQISC